MKLILLGAPGAGKGTQAQTICEKLNIPSISTGNIIREAINQATDEGILAKGYVDSGDLVPDEVVIEMLKLRVKEPDCKDGYILDGFPRTITQASALDELGIEIDKVIEIYVPDDVIKTRMGGRRSCPKCGSSFHTEFKPSKLPDTCDDCNSPTVIRIDDQPHTVISRLKVYHDQTAPLKDYYLKQGKLFTVVGQEKVADTSRLTLEALEK